MLIFTLIFFTLTIFAQDKQYPEDRVYTSADRGMRTYRALSLYKTGTFTMTFDDGPHPTLTGKLLDVLKKHQTKATFFVLTNKINEQTFPLIKRMLDEGHIVGSHGPGHDRSSDLAKEEWRKQFRLSFQELSKWYHRAGHEFKKHYYRFPYGDYGSRADYHHINVLKEVSLELMGKNCIHMAFWDIDTADWVPGMTPQEISSNIVAHNEGGTVIDFRKTPNGYVKYPVNLLNPPAGGVILQHDVHEASVYATDLFLQYAKEKNLRILPLDEIDEFKITKDCSL